MEDTWQPGYYALSSTKAITINSGTATGSTVIVHTFENKLVHLWNAEGLIRIQQDVITEDSCVSNHQIIARRYLTWDSVHEQTTCTLWGWYEDIDAKGVQTLQDIGSVEYGTFTPFTEIVDAISSSGKYYKVGKMVTVSGSVALPLASDTPWIKSGQYTLRIGGLPFKLSGFLEGAAFDCSDADVVNTMKLQVSESTSADILIADPSNSGYLGYPDPYVAEEKFSGAYIQFFGTLLLS